MAAVKLEELTPGMILSEEVRDIKNRLLCPNGLCIEERHLRLFKMWGIFEVQVDDPLAPSGDSKSPMGPDSTTESPGQLLVCFKDLDQRHPAIREIMNLALQYRLKNGLMETAAALPPWHPEEISNRDILINLDRIEIQLPEIPSLVFELNETISDPLSSAGDIAQVVNKSPSLTAMLLKIVNSAFYGFRSKIDSISKAVTMLGSKEVSNLALGISIMETFKDIPKTLIEVETFMEHSLACGIAARIVAAYANVAHTEQLFVSGMLHDIGRLVLCKYFPAAARSAFNSAAANDRSLLKTEIDVLKCTHTQIGKKLLRKWKLPYNLENNVYYHHNPSNSPSPELAAVVQISDIITHALGIGASGEHRIPTFDTSAWDRLGLSPGVFQSVVQQMLHQIGTLRRISGKAVV